jgi:uncharacterized protein
MLIDISELLSVNNKEIEVKADIEMQRFVSRMCDYEIIDKKPLLIKLRNTGRKTFTIDTVVDISLMMQCGRCLENVVHDMHISVKKEIDMNESGEDEKDEFFYISDDKLDVEKLVYNEVLVNLPMKVLCSENCKGICNRCGANLNSQTCNCDTTELDPRMSKIRDIFNNFKEV